MAGGSYDGGSGGGDARRYTGGGGDIEEGRTKVSPTGLAIMAQFSSPDGVNWIAGQCWIVTGSL